LLSFLLDYYFIMKAVLAEEYAKAIGRL